MANYEDVHGFILPGEVTILQEKCKGKRVLEIGSYKGKSACIIAPVAKSLVCVDTFKANGSGQTQEEDLQTLKDFKKNTEEFDNIRILVGTSEKKIPRRTKKDFFDVIFIDGLHNFEAVKTDIKVCWSKLKKGGILIFHDTNWDALRDGGVWKAIRAYFKAEEVECNINQTSISIVRKIRDEL